MSNKHNVLNTEDIQVMSDDELFNRMRGARNYINRARPTGVTEDAEVELCYLMREAEVREHRKEFHKQWLRRSRR